MEKYGFCMRCLRFIRTSPCIFCGFCVLLVRFLQNATVPLPIENVVVQHHALGPCVGGAELSGKTWFRGQGAGFGVQGAGCRVQGVGFRGVMSKGE